MRNEVATLAQFEAVVAGGGDFSRAVLSSLDLTGRDGALAGCRVDGALIFGCVLTDAAADDLRDRGALIFPSLPDVPIDPYRDRLYTPIDLYDTFPGGHYADSFDAHAYAWTRTGGHVPQLEHSLAASLHDHAVSDALDDYLSTVRPRHVVGVMGGHALERGTDGYAATARLAMQLTECGMLVASGGGPGAMEAANLGARMTPHGPKALERALEMLAEVPTFRPSIDAWVHVAFKVRKRFSGGADSIGIPTWFYGHEPPNAFATRIAKYCSNALREDVLLNSCRGGLIYLPGAAGTVQELFQAVTASYYATNPADLTPLVLVGVEQWTKHLPAWPLLEALATGKAMEHRIKLVDSVEEAGEHLTGLL